MRKPAVPHVHLQRTHYIKLFITAGCVVSSVLCILNPQWQTHATMLAVVTNVIWVWA